MRRQHQSFNQEEFILGLTLGGFSFAFLIAIIATPFVLMNWIGYKEASVAEGQLRVVQDLRGEAGSRYRLFVSHPVTGDPIQEYEIRDSSWRGVWNSGTILNQSMANEGKVCQVYSVGRRIQRLSWYPVPTEIVCHGQSNLSPQL